MPIQLAYKLGAKTTNANGSVSFGTCAEAIAYAKQANVAALFLDLVVGKAPELGKLPFVVLCNVDENGNDIDGGTVYANPTPGVELYPGCGAGVRVFAIDEDNMDTLDPAQDLVQQVIDSDNPSGTGWRGPEPIGCASDSFAAQAVADFLEFATGRKYKTRLRKDGTYDVFESQCANGEEWADCGGTAGCYPTDKFGMPVCPPPPSNCNLPKEVCPYGDACSCTDQNGNQVKGTWHYLNKAHPCHCES